MEFILTATNLNDSNANPIVVSGIEDLHQTLTVQDKNMSCDVYSFQVVARNAAGASNPSIMTGKFSSAIMCASGMIMEAESKGVDHLWKKK